MKILQRVLHALAVIGFVFLASLVVYAATPVFFGMLEANERIMDLFLSTLEHILIK